MSAEHKRPLYAFLLVAVICGVIIGHTLRSQAINFVRPVLPPAVIAAGATLEPAARVVGGAVLEPIAATRAEPAVPLARASALEPSGGLAVDRPAVPPHADPHDGPRGGNPDEHGKKPAKTGDAPIRGSHLRGHIAPGAGDGQHRAVTKDTKGHGRKAAKGKKAHGKKGHRKGLKQKRYLGHHGRSPRGC